ncbi:DHA2 family efflux MFS transporter permease subunit [Pseudoneobacillus rhizosphaerae]|uniref:Riboflavin transporter RibZ n=1 Tax=Pseudoneobacillus rhizosphaerae TaxID=2880968 RepID=A0A9C7LAQ9_9BACI|nr:DHA2 family efflux MFS transporter permease subunit [Pseudoneobacillus rhizosphaerae]CAG9609391.1 Riboflavin transporter RibZ [Pseudoneobacillus rhizosphaerae]
MSSHIQVKHAKLMAAVLMIGSFIGLFGETALNMALTEIMADYLIEAGTAQWLTTGYLLVLAVFVPLSAYLMRWFTTKQLILAAIIFMLVGSFLGAIAPSFAILLLGRLIQGLGTGIFLPLMFSVVLMIFPIKKRGAVMGIVGLVITAGPALGPTIAGLIISISNWHYIFWIMIILNLLLLLLAAPKMENLSDLSRPKIDSFSLIFSTIGFGGIVFSLATLAESSFIEIIVWFPLLIGIVALLLFITRQFKMEIPMIDLRVFKHPMFALGTVLMVCNLFMILSVAILIPLYLKSVLGYAALAAGLFMLPGNAVNIVMSPVVGSSFDKVGPKIFTRIGYTLITISALIMVLVISATTPVWQIVLLLILFFLGISMTMMPAQTNAMNQLSPKMYADGSAAMNTLTQVAGALGTAIAITMFTIGQNKYIEEHAESVPLDFLAYGVHYAFIVVLIIAILSLIGSFFIKNSRQESLER